MKSTFNISTKAKLFLGFGLIIVAIILLSILSFVSFNNINNAQTGMFKSMQMERNLTEFKADENRQMLTMLQITISKDPTRTNELKKQLVDKAALIAISLSLIENELQSYPVQLQKFNEIKVQLKRYIENREKRLTLNDAGKIEESINMAREIEGPLYEKIRMMILEIEKDFSDIIDAEKAKTESLTQSADITIIIGSMGIILLSIILIFWMIRMLRKISVEIRNGVNILGTSASEILTTVTEVSTGATETATAISETTTTIEEIRQTALMASQKAQSVLENAQKASDAAENGKESVQQTIEGMYRINQQMNLIADSIVKLSEKNRSIGEITSTVNDIADQSNLLAVNAAIEAAKAGEQGRGFAVVAQEIRNLADQSKQATAQVREILNDIQKAVNLAVMSTEQGSKAVENGSILARKSGEMIEILSDTVTEAAQSVIQISTSSQQQMAGMDQIVPAMENIKQASEQNVIGTKQTQTAAHNLSELGQNLKIIIEKFNV